jgi:hypothetical protein
MIVRGSEQLNSGNIAGVSRRKQYPILAHPSFAVIIAE